MSPRHLNEADRSGRQRDGGCCSLSAAVSFAAGRPEPSRSRVRARVRRRSDRLRRCRRPRPQQRRKQRERAGRQHRPRGERAPDTAREERRMFTRKPPQSGPAAASGIAAALEASRAQASTSAARPASRRPARRGRVESRQTAVRSTAPKLIPAPRPRAAGGRPARPPKRRADPSSRLRAWRWRDPRWRLAEDVPVRCAVARRTVGRAARHRPRQQFAGRSSEPAEDEARGASIRVGSSSKLRSWSARAGGAGHRSRRRSINSPKRSARA